MTIYRLEANQNYLQLIDKWSKLPTMVQATYNCQIVKVTYNSQSYLQFPNGQSYLQLSNGHS